ncbi:S-layer homology domain-containing protein [Tepidibacter formicigenes]|uniref:S-layer homology domain-containing protein n=1 Tax=Tepidibacter formicigenes DSM 15518 TaxID=1123349 RepID=A0A1M6QQI9_9FIRM|nr:S-layer homology domain-containing protein [Tepidibacter formicigenes]SHK22549.1 S-layer homology domain-containing protein [Tepidibacter formicigenes DSM 15518]
MKKLFISLILTLSLVFPSFAQVSIDYTVNDNVTKINICGEKNKPTTITISDSNRKYYIDQGVTDLAGKIEFNVQLEKGKTYNCSVNVGNDKGTKSISIGNFDDEDIPVDKKDTVYISIKGYKGYIIRKTKVEIEENDTVLDITKRILNKNDIDYDISGGFVESIDGLANGDKGAKSGWLYNVDGKTPDVGADSIEVRKGQKIEWYYTVDYTKDDRNTSMNNKESEKDEKVDDVISNDEYKDLYKVIIAKDSSESEITKAVEDAVDILNKKANDINTEKDAKKLINHVKDVSKIMNKALKKVDSKYEVKNIADKNKLLIKSLVKSAEKISDENSKKEISTVAVENIDLTLKLVGEIEDENDIDSIVNSEIESAGDLVEKLGKENTKKLNEKTVKLAQQVINKVAIKNIEDNKIKADEVKNMAQKILNKVKDMEQKLEKNNIEVNRALEKKLILNVVSKNKGEAQISLESKIMECGLDKIEVKTNIASFNIKSNTFDKGKDITLKAKKINTSDLSKNISIHIPSNSVVVNFEAKVGNENITKFKEPIEVSIPYKGDIKNKENITVFYINDNKNLEPMGGVYDSETKTVKFITNHFSKYFAKEYTKSFSDLENTKWAKDAVEIMAAKGIVNGKENNKFSPNDNITRAEFAALITRMLKCVDCDSEIPFEDVNKNDWYYKSIASAYSNGLINGKGDTVFDPNGDITREEMSKIIASVLERKGYKRAKIEELNVFKDKEKIASWAKEGVATSVREGIINGIDEKSFVPKQKATRAQAAVMLYRLYNSIMN